MKKLSFIFIALAGLFSLFSCKKDEDKVVLTNFTAAQITSPAPSTSFVLTKPNADSVLTVFTWSKSESTPNNLGDPTYSLEMDTAGNNFARPVVLVSDANTSFTLKVGSMNTTLLTKMNDMPDIAGNYEFRVRSSLSSATSSEDVFSEVITLTLTAYSIEVVAAPLYLLGDGTMVGWNNNANPPLICKSTGEEGKYAIVAHLLASKFIKFQATLGQWAPQWGTDATGTNESGPLVYRETEAVPDPPAIPSPAVEGDYRITADIKGLTYTVTPTSAQLFLVGDATTAGWVNTAGIPFVQDSVGYFSLTTTLTAGGMKFLEVSGQWAPQWGTDATGTNSGGPLIYRPTESVPDPTNIPSPGAGTFTIRIDLVKLGYTITPQ
jgi:starch-binding outer membrane protein SusE/F